MTPRVKGWSEVVGEEKLEASSEKREEAEDEQLTTDNGPLTNDHFAIVNSNRYGACFTITLAALIFSTMRWELDSPMIGSVS